MFTFAYRCHVADEEKLLVEPSVNDGIKINRNIFFRLALLQGASFAFLAPLAAFSKLPEFACPYGPEDEVPEDFYLPRLQVVSLQKTTKTNCLQVSWVIGVAYIAFSRIMWPKIFAFEITSQFALRHKCAWVNGELHNTLEAYGTTRINRSSV
jgi:hypothetical protein